MHEKRAPIRGSGANVSGELSAASGFASGGDSVSSDDLAGRNRQVRNSPGYSEKQLRSLDETGLSSDSLAGPPQFDAGSSNGRRSLPDIATSAPRDLPLRILLVEDNDVNERVILAQLTALGHRTDMANNGLEALEMLSITSYDAVLMGGQMPEMDGYEATRQIRKYEPAAKRHVIIGLTTSVLDGERRRCLEAGMDDYISKPITRCVLDTVLRRQTERASQRPACGLSLDLRIVEELRGLESRGEPVFVQVAGLFISETPARIEALRGAVASGDAASVVPLAHALKGGSSIVGAAEFARLCERVEGCAASGLLDQAVDFVERLEGAFKRARSAIEQELSQTPSGFD